MKSLFTRSLVVAALLGVVFCGCGQTQPEPVRETGVVVYDPPAQQEESRRYFRYAIGDWCFREFGPKHDTEGLCALAKELKVDLDLVPYDQWDAVKAAGVRMACVLPEMGKDQAGEDIPPFVPGFNDPAEHERVYGAEHQALDRAAEYGIKYVIVFTGKDTGEDRDLQFERIVKCFTVPRDGETESLVAKAERLGITFVIEMLNTEGEAETWRGHSGYLGNNTDELVERVIKPIGSENFKLLFDVYHVVMMGEGPLPLISKHRMHIGFVHAAGVRLMEDGHHPQNRGEITSVTPSQVDYSIVMRALVAYHIPKGMYCTLEYIPNKGDPAKVRADLGAAIELCESKID